MYTYIRKGITVDMGWTMEELVQILAVARDFPLLQRNQMNSGVHPASCMVDTVGCSPSGKVAGK
jgi:hypothetical protein